MTTNAPGAQRLSIEQLQQWEALKFGMFIHFGMSTYDPRKENRTTDKPG